MDWQAFLAMGGYAVYVWPAYGLALLVLIVNAVVPHWHERRLLHTLAGRRRDGREPR